MFTPLVRRVQTIYYPNARAERGPGIRPARTHIRRTKECGGQPADPGWATSIPKFGAMLGPWLAGVLLDGGVSARGTFFVFAFLPVAMVVLLAVLGRIQRGLPATVDGSLRTAATQAGMHYTTTPARTSVG